MRSSGGIDDDDLFASAFGGAGRADGSSPFSASSRPGGGTRRARGSDTGMGRNRAPSPEVVTVEKPLPITLEQLFTGTKKKMMIKRKTYDPSSGKRRLEDKTCDIDIRPGYKAGTKIRFKGWGDVDEGGTQDLCFVVTEVRSPVPLLLPATVFLRERGSTDSARLETSRHVKTRRRRPKVFDRDLAQGVADGLEKNRHHHRRQANRRLQRRTHAAGA